MIIKLSLKLKKINHIYKQIKKQLSLRSTLERDLKTCDFMNNLN